MRISSIQSYNFVSFGGFSKPKYPYELKKGTFESEKDAQMPSVRKDMKTFEGEYEKLSALYNLYNAIEKASPYLPKKSKRAQESLLDYTTDSIHTVSFSTKKKLTNLVLCSAQSAYQQDKHDAIFAFNKISSDPFMSKDDKARFLYGMAGAFRDLDKTHDLFEILKAENTLREYYTEQTPINRAGLTELYGGGKNLDFEA